MKVITGIFCPSIKRDSVIRHWRTNFEKLPSPLLVQCNSDSPASRKGDAVFLNCSDTEGDVSKKLWLLCEFLHRTEGFDYLIRLDANAAVNMRALKAFLKNLAFERRSLTHHIGTRLPIATVPRTATLVVGGTSEKLSSSANFEKCNYSPAGAGYILSRRAVEVIVERGRDHFFQAGEANEHKCRTEFLAKHGFLPTLMPTGIFSDRAPLSAQKRRNSKNSVRVVLDRSAGVAEEEPFADEHIPPRKSKFGIVFLHHSTDEVTLNNLQSFRQWNPDATIVTMSGGDPLPGGYSIQNFPDWIERWRKQTAKPGLRARSTDLLVYAWYQNRWEDCEKWLLVEWDTFCACPVEEYFGKLMDRELVASSVHFPEA